MIIALVCLSYLLGMIWFVFCEIKINEGTDNYQEQDHFIDYFDIGSKTNNEKMIIMTYFLFTSLSTVGFGDYYPISNPERILCTIILLFGVAIFSYIMSIFIEMLNSFK